MNSPLAHSVLVGVVTRHIARKELMVFFASPMAYLFLASFIAVTLFIFFWVESFFPRNIADVRPMFEWLPILLIFLAAALTMRMWSDENRLGTLEFIVTAPVSTLSFVVGKFYACVTLLIIALLLTLPLPLSVSLIADIDWGPVVAGYLATVLLGAAYIAIGLFVSVLHDNQIISLMITTLICALLYLVGSDQVTALFGHDVSLMMQSIGSGARFESVARGVLDFRDLYYYLSLVIAFLALNTYGLERRRWADDGNRHHHWRWHNLTLLIVGNVLVANVWLSSITTLRVDLTEGKIYSISAVTKDTLKQLQEPLVIRGYFSDKTHPMLAPLIPQIKDLIAEYGVVGRGRVKSDFVDPTKNDMIEDEARSKYGLQPVPLQVADRYQAALVNAYFNVVVQYGDMFEVLGFNDLVEIKVRQGGNPEVKLRNPEYDITRSIQRVLRDYQSEGQLFDTIQQPLKFTAYISSAERLPVTLGYLHEQLRVVLTELQGSSNGKLDVEYIDPHANGVAERIEQLYGFRPMTTGFLEQQPFYFYMVLADANKVVKIPLPENGHPTALKFAVESAIKKFAPGWVKTVGVFTPQADNYPNVQFEQLRDVLDSQFNVSSVDLARGVVPTEVDVLLLLRPEGLVGRQLFAVDQFLMQGGSVVIATSPFKQQYINQRLVAGRHDAGLSDWLQHLGITVTDELVMDINNIPYPLAVERKLAGVSRREVRLVDYPYFVDIRGAALNQESAITRGLDHMVMAWSSPILVDQEKNDQRSVTSLLQSSGESWANASSDIAPVDGNFSSQGRPGPHIVGVSLEGQFDSYFANRESAQLIASLSAVDNLSSEDEDALAGRVSQSPPSSRLVLFASNEFLHDATLQLISYTQGVSYQKPLQLLINALEWSLRDDQLAAIRGRSHFSRTLPPLDRSQQQWLEYLNYMIAAVSVLFVVFIQRASRKKRLMSLSQSVDNVLLSDGHTAASSED